MDNFGNPTATAEWFNPKDGKFSAALHTMRHVRAHHSATPVAGGCVRIVSDTSAELFTDAHDSFVSTAAPGIRRLRHAAVALADGRVLVAGGYDTGGVGEPHDEMWSVNGKWQQVDMIGAGSFDRTRFGQTASRLADGRVLLVGGSTYLNPAFPAGSLVSLVATSTIPRIVKPGGRVLPGRPKPTATIVTTRCDGWSGDATGSGTSIQLRMVGDKTVAVSFSTATGTFTDPKPKPKPQSFVRP